MLNDRINGELQKLIGKLKPLNDLCENEDMKLAKGEESLISVCNELKCKVKPVPLKLAQYVSFLGTKYLRIYIYMCVCVLL